MIRKAKAHERGEACFCLECHSTRLTSRARIVIAGIEAAELMQQEQTWRAFEDDLKDTNCEVYVGLMLP